MGRAGVSMTARVGWGAISVLVAMGVMVGISAGRVAVALIVGWLACSLVRWFISGWKGVGVAVAFAGAVTK